MFGAAIDTERRTARLFDEGVEVCTLSIRNVDGTEYFAFTQGGDMLTIPADQVDGFLTTIMLLRVSKGAESF
jgi:hypothetical protein